MAHARSCVYNSTTFIFCSSLTSYSLWIVHLPPPLPHFIFPLLISVTGAWFHWRGGSWLEGMGKQRWRSGESTRLPPMWPRFESWRQHHYVGWVCCWFSSLLQKVFLRVVQFSPFLENQHFQIPIHAWTRFNDFLKTPKCSVGKQITNYNYRYYNGT